MDGGTGNSLVLWGRAEWFESRRVLFAVDVAGEVVGCREMRLSAEICSTVAFYKSCGEILFK
jgi:hypothetical protein